jgi:Flp pilus assembly protein TadG
MNRGNDLDRRSPRASYAAPRFLRKLWRDRRAVAATEFAMVLPFLLILLIGMAEITGAMNQDRKVSRISNSIADLVAQAQTVTSGELDAVMDLGAKILAPYPSDGLGIVVASVSFDEDGDPEVDWSHTSGKGVSWPKGAAPPVTFPSTVASPNTSIVVCLTTLEYVPPFAGIVTNSKIFYGYFERSTLIELSEIHYLRPRLTDTVACSNC